jgi:hypothetical protein
MVRRALAALLASTVVAAPAVGGTAPLVGVADGRLVRVDRDTLRPIGTSPIDVGSGGCASRAGGTACWTVPAWTFSPDRAVLAVARNGAAVSSLTLIDARRLRTLGNVQVGPGAVGAVVWRSI